MNLFLDDRRMPPTGFAIVRTYDECILLLETCEVIKLSLDYHLGSDKTGYDVAKWLVEHGRWPKEIYLHTSSLVLRDAMYQLLMEHKPDWVAIYPYRSH